MNRTILSINVNRPMNYLLQTVLSKKYHFVSVSDVFFAMSSLRKNKDINLVIADIDNAEQDIWELIEHINTSKLYQTSIIVLCSENDAKIDAKMKELGLKNLVKKPFSPPELVKKIDEIMLTEVIHD
ncbi:MAG: response regulator [Chitinophagaceae bacterium]|nr:response regulator [Chitinophagaceae bacterium]